MPKQIFREGWVTGVCRHIIENDAPLAGTFELNNGETFNLCEPCSKLPDEHWQRPFVAEEEVKRDV